MNKHTELIERLRDCADGYEVDSPSIYKAIDLLEQYGKALERLASDDHELPVIQPVGTKWDAADFLQADLNVIQAFAKSTIEVE